MSDKTLGAVVDVFLDRYKQSTRQTYSDDLGMMMKYVGSEIRLVDIEPFDLVRAIQSYERRSSVNSVHTVNKLIQSMTTFFNWARNVDLIEKSPMASISKKKISDKDKEIKAMPQADFDKALGYYQQLARLKPRYCRAVALFLFLFDSGCRRAGASGLQWKDLHLDLDVPFAYVIEKGDIGRDVWFYDNTVIALRQWQLVQKVKHLKGDEKHKAYVFSANGVEISARSLGGYFRSCCKEAGIGSWGTHSIRHNFGNRLDEAGVSSRTGGDALGHRDGGKLFAQTYARRDRELAKRATLDVSYGASKSKTIPLHRQSKDA